MKYAVILSVTFFFHHSVYAYSCIPNPIEEEIENSTYIFTGKVLKKEVLTEKSKIVHYRYRSLRKNTSDFSMSFREYKSIKAFDQTTLLTIEKCTNYKGDSLANIYIVLKTFQLEMLNGPYEKGDEEFLFYCKDSKLIQGMPILTFDLCSRVNPVKYAEKDIEYLEAQTF